MGASESPFQSYKSIKANFAFHYFNLLILRFLSQSAKKTCLRFAILSYSEKL